MTEIAIRREKSILKGLVAGLVAGIVATAVKSVAERFYPPRTHGEPNPPELLAERVAGHPLDTDTKKVASEAIHWGFGAVAGAAYGVAAEYFPAATQKDGAAFGLLLMTMAHETALPAMDLGASVDEQTAREHTSETATHILFGVVTERVRRLVRRVI